MAARYRLDELAGAGGMSTVWRARDIRLDRQVAIKVMSDSLAADPGCVARFAREVRTHMGISHPNLVTVYDYSVTAVQPYLVMEYITGVALSHRVADAPLDEPLTRRLACELLSALACVHDHGVLHRDIKPANVLLDADGHAHLTDFGLARPADASRLTLQGEVVGTLRFLAPELLDGVDASRQSDLYALGVLLRSVTDGLDPSSALGELVGWLTQADPRGRPSDAQAALTALVPPPAHAQAPMPASAQHEQGHRPPPHPARRQRAAAVCALASAAIVTGVLALSAGGQQHPSAGARGQTAHRVTGTAAVYTRPTSPLDDDLNSLAAAVRHTATSAAGR